MDWTDERRRRIISILALAIFTSMIGNGLVNPLITLYSEGLGAAGIWLGVVFSAFALSRALLNPLIGRISDRYDRRLFLIVGMAAYTAVSFLYIIPTSVGNLVIVRILHGAASAAIAPVVMAYGSDLSLEGKRGETLGFLTAARFLGFGVGPAIGGIIGTFFGITAAFISMGVMGALSLAVIIFLLPSYKPKQTKEMKRTRFHRLLAHRSLLSMALFRLFMAFGMAFTVAFLPLRGEELGISIVWIGLFITFNAITAAIFQYYAGRWADRFNKVQLIMVGSLLIGVSLALMGRATHVWSFMATGILMAFSQALAIPASAAITSSIGKHVGHGSAMGMWNFGQDLGVGIGPLVAGFALGYVGFQVLFVVMGLLAFVGMLIAYALLLSDPKRKEYLS